MATLTFTQQLVTVECCSCHQVFALPAGLERQLRDDHSWFYCPLGHRQHFAGKSEEEKLRDQLEAARQLANREARRRAEAEARAGRQEARAETAERSATAYRGHVTRLKRRVAAGKCPCCHRQFDDLTEHMHDQHPDYAAEPAPSR